MSKGRVIFIRHGESIWNAHPVRFTGWANVPLTEKGRIQAREAGQTLSIFGIKPNVAITSLLRRSKESLEEIMKSDSHYKQITIINSWRMNERHYGALVGLSKEEASEAMGHELVSEWRKSWDVAPPPLLKEDAYAYREAPWAQPVTIVTEHNKESIIVTEKDAQMPLTESLEQCCNRVLPLWIEVIQPRLFKGETILIVAHANSIRSIVKHIDHDTITNENVRKINIPSAIPLIYDFEMGQPRGKPDPKFGMRGRYIASQQLLYSLKQSLTGDNENDEGFLNMLDERIINALSLDPKSHLGSKGAVLIGTDKQSIIREHYAKTALSDNDAEILRDHHQATSPPP